MRSAHHTPAELNQNLAELTSKKGLDYKKVQELGLQRAYSDNDAIYQYVRKTMAHQFLLHPETQPMFIRLEAQAQTDLLRKLVNYIRRQWIESQVFPR
ncbi:hypothetical protein ACROYT_G015062 [Oculina patagonica]